MKSFTTDFRFVQTEKPLSKDIFDRCYTYVFFVRYKDINTHNKCRLKYVCRAEIYGEVCAIKFYASRDRKSDYDKYSLAHSQLPYSAIMTIFDYRITVMKEIMKKFPEVSFVFKGAEAYDPRTHRQEDEKENQRFRIYRSYLSKRVGTKTFQHSQFPDNSIYLLTNISGFEDIEDKQNRLREFLSDRFGIPLS